MDKIKYWLEKFKVIIVLVVIITVLLFSILYTILRPSKKEDLESLEVKQEVTEKKDIEQPEKIKVDIKGYVKNPGVYEMDNNSRIIDVINSAGGLKDEANTEYINLSKKVTDEMIIIIYSNSDVEKFKQTDKQTIYIEYECVCPDNKNDACISENDTINTNGAKNKDSESKSSETSTDLSNTLVSINTGTLEELMTLSGIGKSKAQAIIDYREEQGNFENLEDIMNVSGIGEAAYSKIKDNIKL